MTIFDQVFDLRLYINLLCLSVLLSCSQGEHRSAGISEQQLRRHIKTLASDEFEGRAPTTPGEEKTLRYLTTTLDSFGVLPGVDSTYLQKVPLLKNTVTSTSININKKSGGNIPLIQRDDIVCWSKTDQLSVSLDSLEIVFVGYGINAPEFGWNDYKNVDVKGKVVMCLVNDPGYQHPDDSLFNGKAITYYGRWKYKIEEAAKQGAVGILLVHQTKEASYPWAMVQNTWTGSRFSLLQDSENRLQFESWLSLESAKKILESNGQTFDSIYVQSGSGSASSFELSSTISVHIEQEVEKVQSNNVVGYVPGNKRPDEYIVYTAHWDHYGIDTTLVGDQIFNGAIDNAQGVASLLEFARLFSKSPAERSIVFVFTTCEETGALAGSGYYAEHPIFPLDQTVANINLDGIHMMTGIGKNVVIIGHGKTNLDTLVEKHAAQQGRTVVPDPFPENGDYYKSDHIEFAKKGVPSTWVVNGPDDQEKGDGFLDESYEEYASNCYHQPCDEMKDSWIFDGLILDLELIYSVTEDLANTKVWPEWQKGVEFSR